MPSPAGCNNGRVRQRLGAGLIPLAAVAIGASAAGCHRYRPPVPVEQLTSQQMAGRAVFATQCALCHADRTDQAKNGPALVSIFQKPILHSGAAATDERVTATVMHGHGMMRGMADRVDAQQMTDLLAYLHTL